MVQSPSWEANWFAANQEIPRIFMEPEGSLPHSQASATRPYPGLAQSSPHTHNAYPRNTPPGDSSGGAVYLRIEILSPQEALCL